MDQNLRKRAVRRSRRDFLRGTIAVGSLPLLGAACPVGAAGEPAPAARPKLAFAPEGKQFSFDTGALLGTLRPQGKRPGDPAWNRSLGLLPFVESASGVAIANPKGVGVLSHYRMLDADARYGVAAWDWASQSRLLADGSVETRWSADEAHPFDMRAVYHLADPNTVDVVTTVTAHKELRQFEVFLASYFQEFAASFVYVKGCAATGGKTAFLQAKRSNGDWQMFPREGAQKMIGDGRWERPPNPPHWKIMPPLAAPLAIRRQAKTGLAAVLMAPADDCFAVSTPWDEDSHCSLYLSLLGRDLTAGRPATARARLVVARDVSDQRAIALYEAYLKEKHE
jgi:hypothetical protein